MAYLIHHCDTNNQSPLHRNKNAQKELINRVVLEDTILANSALSFVAPVGLEIDNKNGSIQGKYIISLQEKPSLTWRIDNNILFIEGLSNFTINIQPNNKTMQDINIMRDINIPITSPLNVSLKIPPSLNDLHNIQVDMKSHLLGTSLMGYPPPDKHCPVMLLFNAVFEIDVCVTSEQIIDYNCRERMT